MNDEPCGATDKRISDFFKNLPEKNAFGEKIRVVAAVKTRTSKEISLACANGVTEIGENKIQELNQKLGLYPKNATLHFIGHLQTNKVKYAVGNVDLIQSIDSLHLAQAVNARAEKLGITQKILLEINSGDPKKFGFSFEETQNAFEQISKLKNVKLEGIMTVLPSFYPEKNKNDGDFNPKLAEICAKTRELYQTLKKSFEQISVLSMGMSHDYKEAVKGGSNMLRIGEALFGKRVYPEKVNLPSVNI